MPIITREGRPPMHTFGELPRVGTRAPAFVLTNTNMNVVSLENFRGKNVIMNIFPSADTPTCERSILKFNQEATSIHNTVVLCISMDTPFAHKRFCAAKDATNIITLSATTRPEFGRAYGVRIEDGYLEGYFARAIVAFNEAGIVIHNELVPELTQEPNYGACIDRVKASTLAPSAVAYGVSVGAGADSAVSAAAGPEVGPGAWAGVDGRKDAAEGAMLQQFQRQAQNAAPLVAAVELEGDGDATMGAGAGSGTGAGVAQDTLGDKRKETTTKLEESSRQAKRAKR